MDECGGKNWKDEWFGGGGTWIEWYVVV